MQTNNKLREALTESRNLLHRLANLTSAGKEHWAMAKVRAEEIVNITSEKIPAMIMQISAALAAPPRNCDVGTAEEQYKRFMDMCNSKDARQCAECSMRGWHTLACTRDKCFARWAQTPYTEGGAK